VNLQSAGASNQLVVQTTPHGYSPADGYLQGSQQPVQAAVGPQTPASPNLGSLLRGFFTGISSPRLGGWSGAVGRGGQAALGEPPPQEGYSQGQNQLLQMQQQSLAAAIAAATNDATESTATNDATESAAVAAVSAADVTAAAD